MWDLCFMRFETAETYEKVVDRDNEGLEEVRTPIDALCVRRLSEIQNNGTSRDL